MKKVFFLLFLVLLLLYFKIQYFSMFDFSNSLDDNEIALTFINDSLLMVNLKNEKLLFSMEEEVDVSIINKYGLNEIPIYIVSKKSNVDNFNITYNNSREFSFVFADRKFCVGKFYDCDFTYLYRDDSYIDADIYFYNLNTINLLDDIDADAYFIKPMLSIVWDEKNYMIVNH